MAIVKTAHARITTVYPKANQVTLEFENQEDAQKMISCYYKRQTNRLLVSVVNVSSNIPQLDRAANNA